MYNHRKHHTETRMLTESSTAVRAQTTEPYIEILMENENLNVTLKVRISVSQET